MILAVLVLTSCGYFPPVCSSTRWYDYDVPWSCAASAQLLPGGSTPHSARSSNRARQWHFIRAERSSNGSCRSHRALEGSSLRSCFVPFFFLPRLATPALRLGVIVSLRPSVFHVFLRRHGRRSGQPAIELVSGKKGLRPHFAVFAGISVFIPYDVTGTRLLRDRLLGHPDVRKRPWPLRRPRGDGNGGRFVRSPCLPSWRGLRFYAIHQMLSFWHLFPFVPCTATVH